MATQLSRRDFRRHFSDYSQGLFIVSEPRFLPKEQAEVNIGKRLSVKLAEIAPEERTIQVFPCLSEAVEREKVMIATHVEILFTPSLELDPVGMLLSLCRNRKICIAWPGTMLDGKLFYATPDSPEYYECDPRALQDTYIIID